MSNEIVMAPVHPGEVLDEEYLGPLGVTQYRLAVAVGVPPRRINEIVHGKRRITADTALQLARSPVHSAEYSMSFRKPIAHRALWDALLLEHLQSIWWSSSRR